MFVDIFGAPWSAIQPSDIETFVGSASGEGLIWEGKAGVPLPELIHKIRHGVCGLANQLGGVFIIGAEQREDESWHLPGVPLGGLKEDPHDWLCRIVTGGLVNAPPFDVKCWLVSGGQIAAAIWVEPIAAPPCITIDGTVYQRVVGETRRITDPGILRDLIQRGNAARDEAERRALEALPDTGLPSLSGPPSSRRIDLALSPVVALATTIESRLFTPTFRERLLKVANALPVSPYGREAPALAYQSRDGYLASRGGPQDGDEGIGWVIRAGWDGVFVGSHAANREAPERTETMEVIRLLWDGTAALARFLPGTDDGARFPTHLAVTLTHGQFSIGRDQVSVAERPIQRWVDLSRPDADQLFGISVELRRGGGAEVFE